MFGRALRLFFIWIHWSGYRASSLQRSLRIASPVTDDFGFTQWETDDAYLNVTANSTCTKSVAASFNEDPSTFSWYCQVMPFFAGSRGYCVDETACLSEGCYYCNTYYYRSGNYFCTDFPNTNSTTHSCVRSISWEWRLITILRPILYFLVPILYFLCLIYCFISLIVFWIMRFVLQYNWDETYKFLNQSCCGYGAFMECNCFSFVDSEESSVTEETELVQN